jgi:hypothetical protein
MRNEPNLATGQRGNPTMFWQPLGTYCLNMAPFEKKNSQNVATWAYFSKKNPLYPLHWIFFPK